MKNTIWGKHIPTLLGIGIITIGIAITSFLVKSGAIFTIRASPAETPQEVKISNITDTSFTVSYTTKNDSIGSVNFGKDKNLESVAFDDRDQKSGSVTPYKTHSITVKNLEAQTRYFFSITSGQNLFSDNGNPFEVSTYPTIIDQPLSQVSLKGQIILPNGDKPKEAIVYATTDNSQAISTIVNEDGSYVLPLNTMRGSDLSSYYAFSEDTIIKILIENDTLKSNVTTSAYQDTLPTITLSNDYDFTVSKTPIASKSAESLGFSSIPVTLQATESGATTSPQILLPKKDQEFTDQKPQFSGTAVPNETVTITIQSEEEIKTQVTTDAFGNWKYRPSNALSPGEHTITITTRDAFGILKTITQSFTVYAQGSQVSQSATPSATPTLAFPTRTPTPTPTRTPTPTPGKGGPIIPTPTPTPILIAQNLTPTPTLISTSLTTTPTPTLCPGCPTPTPTSSIPLSPTTTAGTPAATIAPPGDSSVATIGILGVAVAAIGGLLFLLSRTGI